MNPTERIVNQLLIEAGEEYIKGAVQAILERHRSEIANLGDMIIMCGCNNWVECCHPWPQIIRAPQFNSEEARV
mgnify:CR=1 FL=1